MSTTRTVLSLVHKQMTRVNDRVGDILERGAGQGLEPLVKGLDHAYATGWRTSPCVFVLSTGRVGTQTLTALLALSPGVVAVHEPSPRLIKASFDAYMEGGAGEKWRAVVLAARDDAIWNASRSGRVYAETNNRLTYLASALSASFPASRFIHLHRHPYEVVRSGMRRGFYQGHTWDFARIRPRPDEALTAEWPNLTALEKTAWYWMRVNSEARQFLLTLPVERRLELRADTLFSGDAEILEQLFNFVGVDHPSSDRVHGVLRQKLNVQRKGDFPLPSEWSEPERQLVKKTVSEVAASLGYEI